MRRINFYENFEAQKQAEIEETLHMTPEERIRLTVLLIRKVYADVKREVQNPKRINFIVVTR
jgi:hypothetical protein